MNETIIQAINETATKSSSLISTIDPNWLYSAIAQSSAAIVGLMGAFLTTKLISQKSIIKNIETQIIESRAKIEFLKEGIKEKETWVEKIDEEDNLKDIKNFLEEMEDEINIDNPPNIDELIEIAKKSENESFHNLNKKMLEKSYNEEFLKGVRERRRKYRSPFVVGTMNTPSTFLPINPQILGRKWDRYRRYNDEISITYTEIKHIENLIRTKESELNIEKAGLDLKKTFFYLASFSIVGVFLPLFILSLSPEIMYLLRFITLSVVLLGWIFLLIYLINEITTLKNSANIDNKDAKTNY